jgi:hypothetical protein
MEAASKGAASCLLAVLFVGIFGFLSGLYLRLSLR